MAVRDITTPYNRATSYLYDRLIAPAVVPLIGVIETRWAARLAPDAAVLDVGCGGGQVALELARRHPGYRVTGLDLSADQVRRARRRAGEPGAAAFVEGSALDLPFPDGQFDAVYSIASLKHWPDIARGAAECARVLKPGGLLCLVEVERGILFDEAHAFLQRTHVAVPGAGVPAAMAFMAFVAGRGWHIDEARALAAALPLDDAAVERVPEGVSVVVHGTRR